MTTPNRKSEERRLARGLWKKEDDVRLLILEMLGLPILPALLNRILRVCEQGVSSPEHLSEVISADEILTGNILETANSNFLGLPEEVPGIPRAIKVLGYESVKSLALSELLMETAASRDRQGLFDRRRFRMHSLACAAVSKKIAVMTRGADSETTFVCGLLHDIGKPFLAICFPESYGGVLARLEREKMTSVMGEADTLGFTHIEVGMWLAQRWSFSKPVVFAIANHHGMAERDDRYNVLASILRVADHICLQEQVSLENRVFIEPLESVILEELMLGTADLLELRRTLAAEKIMLASLAETRDDAKGVADEQQDF